MNIDFMTKSMAGKQLTYDSLKLYIMQVESIKMQTATATTDMKTAHLTSMDKERCYGCDGFGHMSKDCPRSGTGMKQCFECKQFCDHIAANCPQRLQRQREHPSENSRYGNIRYKPYNRGNRGGRGRYSGEKRKGDNVDYQSDPKRPKQDKQNMRGKRRNWRGRERGGAKHENTKAKDTATDGDNSEYSITNPQNIKPHLVTDIHKLDQIKNSNTLLSRFLIDTGATEHSTNSRLIYKDYKEAKDEIKCANKNENANLKSEGVGTVEIYANENKLLKLDNVIYAENLSENLGHCENLPI